jgi:hypothetical protein
MMSDTAAPAFRSRVPDCASKPSYVRQAKPDDTLLAFGAGLYDVDRKLLLI